MKVCGPALTVVVVGTVVGTVVGAVVVAGAVVVEPAVVVVAGAVVVEPAVVVVAGAVVVEPAVVVIWLVVAAVVRVDELEVNCDGTSLLPQPVRDTTPTTRTATQDQRIIVLNIFSSWLC